MNAFRSIHLLLILSLGAGGAVSAAAEKPPAEKTPLGEPRGTAGPFGEPEASRPPAKKSRTAAKGDATRPTRTDVEPIDINTADQAALESHPLIGPAAAKAIIVARPFSSLDDLHRLQGLSPERIEQLRLAVAAPAVAAESPAPDRAGPEQGKVDVNTADRATLEKLSSVGSDLAGAIIAARPFARIDDLDRIQGISAERLEHMRTELKVATPGLAATQKQSAPRRSKSDDAERPRDLEPTGRKNPDSRR